MNNDIPDDAQSSETDLCMLWTVVQFLVFEIWPILYSNFVVNWGLALIENLFLDLIELIENLFLGLCGIYFQ